jgi:hypothetical protein
MEKHNIHIYTFCVTFCLHVASYNHGIITNTLRSGNVTLYEMWEWKLPVGLQKSFFLASQYTQKHPKESMCHNLKVEILTMKSTIFWDITL